MRIDGEKGDVFARNNNTEEWQYWSDEIVKDFRKLERLAPFKDKDGGDLYEGDIVRFKYNLVGVLEFNSMIGWCLNVSNDNSWHINELLQEDVTKLGNIYEEE